MKPLSILLILAPLLVSGEYDNTSRKVGTWNVNKCILAQFSMNFTLELTNYKPNQTEIITVPSTAVVNNKSSCGDEKSDQMLVLTWTDKAKNDSSVDLDREITISFRRNLTQSL